MATNTKDAKVVTGPVRLAFVNLFEARSSNPDQPPKFGCCLMIPKDDTATLKKIKDAQAAAAELGKGKFNGKVPANLKTTLHDGDEEQDLEKYPEFAGHYYMNISANESYPPGIVDANVNPILDRSEVYSGMWARVSMNAFAYNSNGNRGISFGLRHVQKVRDDEPFGGSSRAADDFDALDDEEESLI